MAVIEPHVSQLLAVPSKLAEQPQTEGGLNCLPYGYFPIQLVLVLRQKSRFSVKLPPDI